MARQPFIIVALVTTLVLLLAPSFTFADDQSFYELLYDRVADVVLPPMAPNSPPVEVLLMETTGISIIREQFDDEFWSQNNYVDRMPAAHLAELVDRIPIYTGTTFIDSGARFSTLWRHFMRQYRVPVINNANDLKRANTARQILANTTLDADLTKQLDLYLQSVDEAQANRDSCLSQKTPEACSRLATIWKQKISQRWYSSETVRRQLVGAQATIIALEAHDLQTTFAEALESFSSSEKVDVGQLGFGDRFLDTRAQPDSWWKWWPVDSTRFDYKINVGSSLTISLKPYVPPARQAAIVTFPQHGTVSILNSFAVNNITYTPGPSYTGSDLIGYSDGDDTVRYVRIAIVGSDVTSPNPAFVSVSASSAQSVNSAQSTYRRLQVSDKNEYSDNFVRVSGSVGVDSYTSSQSFTSSTTTTQISFELARVRISRPWFDPSLLSFYPVAIAGIRKAQWSDGSPFPARPTGTATFTAKIIPTSFLVARNIRIQRNNWDSVRDLITGASSTTSSGRVQIGPFFVGASSASSATGSTSYKETATFSGNTLLIPGPQIIGWVCSPLPAFPSASEDEVTAYEKKYNAVDAATTTTTTATPTTATPTTVTPTTTTPTTPTAPTTTP